MSPGQARHSIASRYLLRLSATLSAITMVIYLALASYVQLIEYVKSQQEQQEWNILLKNHRYVSIRDTEFTHDSRKILQNIRFLGGQYGISSGNNSALNTKLTDVNNDNVKFDKRHHLNEANQKCKPKRNFVFIKCMKCATETMETVLRRYGYTRNLSFVVPSGNNIYLGWPFKMAAYHYRPQKTEFNIITEHAIYDRNTMHQLMPRDTVYITIIREPYLHFQSTFYYFSVANVAKVAGPDPISEFLRNLHQYDAVYRSHEAAPLRFCIPDDFSITRNLQSQCLGLPLGFPSGTKNFTDNLQLALSYFKILERDFSLVMLVEYFLESLVLLKRLMCWSTKDIIFKTTNVMNYSDKRQRPYYKNVAIYKTWSSLDYLLYDYFYKVFQNKISAQSPDFFDEVKQFHHIQTLVTNHCQKNDTVDDLVIAPNHWDPGFNFTLYDCTLLNTYLLDLIKDQYESL